MKIKSKPLRFFVLFFFIVYILILLKIILFKYGINLSFFWLRDRASFGINLLPFDTIIRTIKGFGLFNMNTIINIVGNIIIFSPLGFFLPIIFAKYEKLLSVIVFSFITSLIFEVIQYITDLGAFDIDDIILNILGGWVGFLVYRIIDIILKKYKTSKLISKGSTSC